MSNGLSLCPNALKYQNHKITQSGKDFRGHQAQSPAPSRVSWEAKTELRALSRQVLKSSTDGD